MENYFPWIANRQQGEIPYYLLCDEKGIYTSDSCKIVQFKLTYSGEKGIVDYTFEGNTIPDSICIELGRFAVGTSLFISNIIGLIDNEPMHLSSMYLQLKRKEDE